MRRQAATRPIHPQTPPYPPAHLIPRQLHKPPEAEHHQFVPAPPLRPLLPLLLPQSSRGGPPAAAAAAVAAEARNGPLHARAQVPEAGAAVNGQIELVVLCCFFWGCF